MTQANALAETALARESLRRMSDSQGVLRRAARVLELVAHSSVGLGEVLQDYAHQTSAQLQAILRAGLHITGGGAQAGDAQALSEIHYVLKSVKSVLERTPAAMERNKADVLGEKDKLTRADVMEVTQAFLHSPDVTRLLAAEDSGDIFASLASGAESDAGLVAKHEQTLAAAGQ